MKITRKAEVIALNNLVDVSVDVHKDTLCFFFSLNGKEYSDSCANRTRTIEKKLTSYQLIARQNGRASLRIICEPTGQYHNTLMRTARRLGCFTNIVNAEAVAKFRLIESNDTNKTDRKDPRVIATLGSLNKVLRYRFLTEDYLMLRKLHKIYDECDVSITRQRCKISRLLVDLFCDYSFSNDFLYSSSGEALFKHFGCNPYRIVATGFGRFCLSMKQAVPRIRAATLEQLWHDAEQSVRNEQPEGYHALLEEHLGYLLQDYQVVVARKKKITEQMISVLKRIREHDPLVPPPAPQVISEKNLARFLAETGPLSDFTSYRQLMRYAGLNLRTRQSGTYQGQNKISKKGRKLLRKVLQAIALPLVRKGRLYGTYYHAKRDRDKMVGNKAMTVVARHLLRKLYGWCRSGQQFDEKRFFTSKTEYEKFLRAA